MMDFVTETSHKKFSVISLGCRVNRTEVDDYSAHLISSGWEFAPVAQSDLVIINTCTVTAVADKKTRKAVRRACTQNTMPDTKIVVTGCASAMESGLYKDMDPRIVVIPKTQMKQALNLEYSGLGKVLAGEGFRTRSAIKIQDGCNNACTYCIVHTARGKSISLQHDEIFERFTELVEAGVKEVVLTGVNLGAYDDGKYDISELCKALLNIAQKSPDQKPKTRIRLSSIEPQNVSDQLIDLMACADGQICRHLHLPLQSGSSKVLHEMARHYSAEEYLALVKKLKEKIPQIALSTDIIVGFPGETDADFAQTVALARECGFMKIHVFPYSVREGTPAAARKDQVSPEIKSERAAKLRQLSDELAMADLKARNGSTEAVLIENQQVARTESFHEVVAPADAKPGDLVLVVL